MIELQNFIKNKILPNTKGPKGFSIFHYNNNYYDVYIPTNDFEKYYFFTYVDGTLFDLYINEMQISDILNSIYETVELIEENFAKVIHFTEIYIEEHDRLSYKDYKNPKETNAYKYIENGNQAFQEGDFQEAYNNYNQAVLLEPYESNHFRSRSTCFVKSKQFNGAIADVCRAAIANPVSNQNIFTFVFEDLAAIYRISNNFEKAVEIYSFIYKNNKQPWIIQKRAKCYTELEEFELAIQDYELLINDERKIEILIELAEVVLKSGNKNKAEKLLNEVINFSVKNDEAWIVEMVESRNKVYKDRAKKLIQQL